MAKLSTTTGQLLINEALPIDMRDYRRVLDKKSLSKLLGDLARKHPKQYRDVSHKLSQIGKMAAFTSGGNSFGLQHMTRALSGRERRLVLGKKLKALYNDNVISDDMREQQIIKLTGELMAKQQNEIFDESKRENNPLAIQLLGAGRGNKMNLASLRGSDGLYQDHREKIIPVPVLRSYAQGLSPLEYWAGTYGARQGVMAVKFATQEAGFLSKQLNQIAHRSLITQLDKPGGFATLRGLPVDVSDPDNEGSLLAHNIGGYKANTVLTPSILKDLKKRKVKRILVRSPAVTGTPDGGVYARDAGVREFNRLPSVGENVGLVAAQALSEPLAQAQLSAKHTGGVAGESKAVSGFDYINQLVQVPRVFKGGAAHSTVDGIVQSIEDAPAGGKYVMINNQKHYVASGYELKVKKGSRIEAGDVISEGSPNPAMIVQYKGIGEGRRYFIKSFQDAFRSANLSGHRRNVELLARGLINHVRLTKEVGSFVPDDIVAYSTLEHQYKPRSGAKDTQPARSLGKYLEKPYLHYTIGTKVRPSMLKNFKEFGVKEISVHDDEPPFAPEMIRGMANLQHDPDWMTRMFGSNLKGSLLKGVHRGAVADEAGTSFVAGRARAVDFGRTGIIRTPKSP